MASGIPTRQSNPFATCWLGPLGTRYVATDGNTPRRLASRLARQNWRGQIIGPHGVGKSTLLRDLEPEVQRLGRRWIEITFHNTNGRHSIRKCLPADLDPTALLVVDGFEQLNASQRFYVQWRCWQSNCGLLITTHRPCNLPTLLRITPDEAMALAVFEQVTSDTTTAVGKDDALRAFNACNRDIRQMFDRLYDLHEQHKWTAGVANNRHGLRVTNGDQLAYRA